jgi:hypothetical protein
VAPAEGPQERAQRRRCRDPLAQHRAALAGAQRIGVVDRITIDQGGGHQRYRLEPDVGPSWRVAQIDVLVEQLAQAEVLGQHHRQQQSAVGDRPIVVEDHVHTVERVR